MGSFATNPIVAHSWVGEYVGTLTTREETNARYNVNERADYLFEVDARKGIAIDAQNSTHWSRFINHVSDASSPCRHE